MSLDDIYLIVSVKARQGEDERKDDIAAETMI